MPGGRGVKRNLAAGICTQKVTCPEKMPGGGVVLFKMPEGPPSMALWRPDNKC